MVATIEAGPGLASLTSLLLASDPNASQQVLARWSEADRVRVGIFGGIDFLFGLLWTNLAALQCIVAQRGSSLRCIAVLAPSAAWLAWSLYLLDFPENISYLLLVIGYSSAELLVLLKGTALLRVGIFVGLVLFLAVGFFSKRPAQKTAA